VKTPYIMARLYRAPEIILGHSHGTAVDVCHSSTSPAPCHAWLTCHVSSDLAPPSIPRPSKVWGLACCLYELHTRRFLFPGADSNHTLRAMQELIGPVPSVMLKSSGASPPNPPRAATAARALLHGCSVARHGRGSCESYGYGCGWR
jgi:serine/threonine protein kinase